ncbi:hypothetical protein C8Q78DRAFT_1112128 [Trametes maxima]|nr:hypothetical protein C8Q78DRAFT_1112128 [Trametes maxima]
MSSCTLPHHQVIHVIQEIRDSVEMPRRCVLLDSLQSDESRRTRARRYRDGAVKIMDLLRPELTSSDIHSYERYYDCFHDIPESWVSERLSAAKKLWEFVLSLDEWLAHARITSTPFESSSRRSHIDNRDGERKVRFDNPCRDLGPPTNTPDTRNATVSYTGTTWWPNTVCTPAYTPVYTTAYTPTWVQAWSPTYVPMTSLSTCPCSCWPGAIDADALVFQVPPWRQCRTGRALLSRVLSGPSAFRLCLYFDYFFRPRVRLTRPA